MSLSQLSSACYDETRDGHNTLWNHQFNCWKATNVDIRRVFVFVNLLSVDLLDYFPDLIWFCIVQSLKSCFHLWMTHAKPSIHRASLRSRLRRGKSKLTVNQTNKSHATVSERGSPNQLLSIPLRLTLAIINVL